MSHRAYHIFLLTLQGKGEILFEDGTSKLVVSNDVFFSHAQGQGHIHKPYGTDPWEILWIQILPDSPWLIPPSNDWIIYPSINKAQLKNSLENLMEEESFNDISSPKLQELCAQQFLLYLQRTLEGKGQILNLINRKRLANLWMEVSISMEKSWTLEDLCQQVNLSKAHLSRLCKEYYQMAPGEKVRSIKMEHAKNLLQFFSTTISETAEFVGYETPSAFSVAFKNYYGYAPQKAKQKE
jgi:AraC-like DNA-binding protein